jgi:hypothetical protein
LRGDFFSARGAERYTLLNLRTAISTNYHCIYLRFCLPGKPAYFLRVQAGDLERLRDIAQHFSTIIV